MLQPAFFDGRLIQLCALCVSLRSLRNLHLGFNAELTENAENAEAKQDGTFLFSSCDFDDFLSEYLTEDKPMRLLVLSSC